MSQIAFTQDERIERLRHFGYTDREAAFLCLAGLHSGYFLRRHYVQFLGTAVGGTAAALIEKALAREHVKTCTYVANAHIYHLCARSFYAALGQEDNRNRRDRQPLTIKSKLMSLDYVLGHRAYRYLATEQEKVAFFTGTLNVSEEALPSKPYHGAAGEPPTVRYFVDKLPIHRSAASHEADSEITFCYVDAGATTASGFATYLDRHARLFRAIPRFRIIYVASRPLVFGPAERVFSGFARHAAAQETSQQRALVSYFETRFRYEHGELASFDRDALVQLRKQRQQFSGPDIDSHYQRWRTCRERAVSDQTNTPNASQRFANATFSTCLLEHNYDVFGTLTAF